MNDTSFSIKSNPIQLHYLSPRAHKMSTLRTTMNEESQDTQASKYAELVPMKGLTSARAKPNPLKVYYKNIDVLKMKRKEKDNQRFALPPIGRIEIEGKIDPVNTSNTSNYPSVRNQPKDASNAFITNNQTNLKESRDKELSRSNDIGIHPKVQRIGLSRSVKASEKLLNIPGADFADIKKKLEYEKLEKRTRKVMEIRSANFYHMKAKYLSNYLGNNAKAQASEIWASINSQFVTPRNEYPILG